MAATTLRQGSGKELRQLFATLTGTIGETLGSLVGREMVVRPLEPEVRDHDAFVAGLPNAVAVARGAMDKGFAGKTFQTLIEIGDAVTMSGLLMMTPDDVIGQRRTRGTLEGEDAEAFSELGNVLYSGFGNVLREKVGNIDIRMQDHGVVQPGNDATGMLPAGSIVIFGFRMKVGEWPESVGSLVVDQATAELWNKGPLELAPDPLAAPAQGAAPAQPAPAGPAASSIVREDDGLESIPAAPIRGTLAAFVIQAEVFRTLRRSCRRVGLDMRRHGRAEIPNPAAHKNEIVLLDVPPGEDRRFDWCRRIKELSSTTKVVLLIHHPSRQRVTQAFLSRADAILGFPCDEGQLSQKLATLLPPPAPETPPA